LLVALIHPICQCIHPMHSSNLSMRVDDQRRPVPAEVLLSPPSYLDVVGSSRSRPRVAVWSPVPPSLAARLSLCCGRQQMSAKCQRRCFFLPPPTSTSSVHRGLVPGQRFRFRLRLRSQLAAARSSAGRRQLQGSRRHRVPTCPHRVLTCQGHAPCGRTM
jgi:hypothetical protein